MAVSPNSTVLLVAEADGACHQAAARLLQQAGIARLRIREIGAEAESGRQLGLDALYAYLLAGSGIELEYRRLGAAALELSEGPAAESVLLLPLRCVADGDDAEILLSDAMTGLLDRLPPERVDEAWLEALAQAVRPDDVESWSHEAWLAEAGNEARRWLALAAAEWGQAWLTRPGARYRQLQQLRLWRYGLIDAGRGPLEAALRRWLADAADAAALLVLWLYKRQPVVWPAKAPSWLSEYGQRLQPQLGRCLHVLPAPANFAVRILIPGWHAWESLRPTLAAIQAQTWSDWRLEIYAGPASAPELELASAADPRIRPHPQALPALAPADPADDSAFLLLLDEGAQPEPELLASCLAFARAQPWCAGAGGGRLQLGASGGLRLGPFVDQAGIAPTQRELERCSLISPLGSGALWRWDAVKRLELPDLPALFEPLPAGAGPTTARAYRHLIDARMLGRFEVGYLPELLQSEGGGPRVPESTVSSAAGAASEQMIDWLRAMGAAAGDGRPAVWYLALLERLIGDYAGLFGQAYPALAARYFLHFRFSETWQDYRSLLYAAGDAAELRARVAGRIPAWKAWQAAHRLLSNCDSAAELLFDARNPYTIQGHDKARRGPMTRLESRQTL